MDDWNCTGCGTLHQGTPTLIIPSSRRTQRFCGTCEPNVRLAPDAVVEAVPMDLVGVPAPKLDEWPAAKDWVCAHREGPDPDEGTCEYACTAVEVTAGLNRAVYVCQVGHSNPVLAQMMSGAWAFTNAPF